MKVNIKGISENRQVFGNFVSLSILNALNVLLPLITLPYIMRTIGEGNYGIYRYVYVVLQYVILIDTYGFNFSATKQISQCRENRRDVTRIYNSVIISKSLIALVLSVALYSLSHFVFRDPDAPMMFLWGLGMVIGDILTPTWLFQGMERMKYMTIVNASSKILFTVLVFVLIRRTEDYVLLILLNSAGYMLAGIMSIILAHRQFGMRFVRIGISDISEQFKNGLAVFGSTMGMNLYRNANVIILKQFVPNEIVGIYSASEAVVKGFQSVISPLAQALFPHISQKFKNRDANENLSMLKKILLPFAGLVLAVSAMVFVAAPVVSDILCGVNLRECVPLIRIMTLVIVFGEINYMIGIVGLVNMNEQRKFFYYVLVAGLASVSFVLLTAGTMQAYGAAWAMVLAEVLLTILCTVRLMKLRQRK